VVGGGLKMNVCLYHTYIHGRDPHTKNSPLFLDFFFFLKPPCKEEKELGVLSLKNWFTSCGKYGFSCSSSRRRRLFIRCE
jgi:hypothetical protein